jgi:hypothetical protein
MRILMVLAIILLATLSCVELIVGKGLVRGLDINLVQIRHGLTWDFRRSREIGHP